MADSPHEMRVAQRAARAGAEIIRRDFQRAIEIRSKESYNLVTDTDLQSEQAIVDVIRQEFPEHVVLGEETHHADVGAEHLWIVDPLDGTNNFAHGVPHFAVSIAYYRGGEPHCGVVFNPIRDDWFWASSGRGAFHNGLRMAVSTAGALNEVLVGAGFYYDRGAMMEATLEVIGVLFRQHIHGIRRFGTASLDLCQVASGRYGAFFEYQLSPWDFAAGRLICEEAGGRVTTCRGDELPLQMGSVLASNGRLHNAMLEIVTPRHP